MSLSKPVLDDKALSPGLYSPSIIGKQGRLYCTLYTVGSKHLSPVVVMAHGFPGHIKNEDIAQCLRQSGFNVLSFSYSGCWGSDGIYSFLNNLDDMSAIIEFILSDKQYNFDNSQIFVVGYSLGCIVAANILSERDEVKAGAFLMPCDLTEMRKISLLRPKEYQEMIENLEDGLTFVKGVSCQQLIEEIADSELLSMSYYAKKLAEKPTLFISGKEDHLAPESVCTVPVIKEIAANNNENFVWRSLHTDHYFANNRTRICAELQAFFSSQIQHKKASVNYASFKKEIFDLITMRYRNITIKDVAAYFDLSVSHTTALIKKCTNMRFSELVSAEKLRRAEILLNDSNLSVSQIAKELGYENATYFMRVFKKSHGCTPTQFRMKNKNGVFRPGAG